MSYIFHRLIYLLFPFRTMYIEMCIENYVLFPNSDVDRALMNTFEPFNTAKLTAEVENNCCCMILKDSYISGDEKKKVSRSMIVII